MMRKDYQPYLRQLKTRLTGLGYVSVKERELDAEFTLYSGWKLSFEGERNYGPMFGIFVIPPSPPTNRRRGYEVGMLMQAFEKLEGKLYGRPTIDGQVDFLIREKEKIFRDPTYYEAQYAKLIDTAP
jgi:hypothetical protein